MRYYIILAMFVVLHLIPEHIRAKGAEGNSPQAPIICVVGDFNDWRFPDNDSDNGAAIMRSSISEYGVETFYSSIRLPEGDSKFAIYRLDPVTYDVVYATTAYAPEFVLTDPSGDNDYPREWGDYERIFDIFKNEYIDLTICKEVSVERSNISKAVPLEIKGWIGGAIDISYLEYATIRIKSTNAPEYEPIADSHVIYAIVQSDDTPAQIIELPLYRANSYQSFVSIFGKKVSVLFSTEKSLTPAPENVWGAPDEAYLSFDEIHASDALHKRFPILRGGKPYVGEFAKYGRFEVSVNWPSGEASARCYHPRNMSAFTAAITSDGVKEIRTLETDPLTGFLPPISVEGKEVAVSFSFYDKDLERDITRSHTSDPYLQLPTDERFPVYTYDKESNVGTEPYAATFKDRGTMTVEYSHNYGICYCRYDGEVETAAAIEEISINESVDTYNTANEVQYFDLMGRSIPGPQKGIYIVLKGNKTRKVYNP